LIGSFFKAPDRSLRGALEAFEVGTTASCELLWKPPFSLEHNLNPAGFVLFSAQPIATRFIRPFALK
jgi:hypothetical protein